MSALASGAADWLASVGDQITSIELRYILLGCLLQAAQTILNGIAWRNILRASFPDSTVPTGPIVAAYAAGVGLNEVLPAQAGTVTSLGLFRRAIPGSRLVTISAGAVAQNLFFAVLSASVFASLLITRPAARDSVASSFTRHFGFWLVVALIVAGVLSLVARAYWGRVVRFWRHARDGAAILRTPRRYLREVVALQACSYALRIAINGTFMHAVGIPVSAQSILLIIAANSLSSSLAVTPGGLGTQQALASMVLHRVAPAALVTAYSLAQETILMLFNLIFGLALLIAFFGSSELRRLVASSRGNAEAAVMDATG